MSCATLAIAPSPPLGPRPRTTSFSTPAPYKAARMGSLRRTTSYLTLPEFSDSNTQTRTIQSSPSSADCSALVQRHHKEQRIRRRRAQFTHAAQFTIGPAPTSSLPPLPQPKPTTSSGAMQYPRASSPLAPCQKLLPPRACFPRSKQAPDLYKVAITTRMRCSPEGQKILSMGPRLAVSILTATRELEKIVASQMEVDSDVPVLTNSWVVVAGDERDWEMVDCC